MSADNFQKVRGEAIRASAEAIVGSLNGSIDVKQARAAAAKLHKLNADRRRETREMVCKLKAAGVIR